MTNPTDKVKNTSTYRDTEGIVSASNTVATLDTGNAEKIELVNKGPNTIFFRTDGTTPTVAASGNADQLASGSRLVIENDTVANVKIICNPAETATVFYRLYS
jgi:hypothetical protein